LIKWWTTSANEWLRNPNSDSELLYVASIALAGSDQGLSRECLLECRSRRKRAKTRKT
tara:strand:+ start:770 stop:943 length:174 start_codon:yes stop_codon:yes gene_type:complete